LGVFSVASAAQKAEEDIAMTLQEFEDRAITHGFEGRQTEWTLETQGYTRDIVFRRTDSPRLTAGHTQTRSGSRTNDSTSESDQKESTLRVDQQTPLGTELDATLSYGDFQKPGLQANAEQPLYIFVKNPVLRARKRADLNFADAKDNYTESILRIRRDARNHYYNVILGRETIEVEERKVQSAKKLMDITQALVQAGRLAPVETMRTKIRVQRDERLLENARVSWQQAVSDAKNYIFYPLDEPIDFTSELEFEPMKATLQRLTDFAMLHNPQLRRARRAQEEAVLNLQEAREGTRPTTELRGTYNYNELPGVVRANWTAQWGVSWMFFDSFITRKEVKSAKIAQFVANLNAANIERDTRISVRNAYLDVRRTEKQIREFTTSREQARRNVDVLRLRFQNGLERIIDVFDAENEMRAIDNEYLNLLASFNRGKDRLSSLIGADVRTLQ
jgi:outer membrane protein TolC